MEEQFLAYFHLKIKIIKQNWIENLCKAINPKLFYKIYFLKVILHSLEERLDALENSLLILNKFSIH